MGIYPEKPSERNIDQLADDIRVVTELEIRTEGYPNARVAGDCPDGSTMARELPPKYEDLDQPPKYDEQMFLATSQVGSIPASNTSTDNSLPSYPVGSPDNTAINTNASGNNAPIRN